MILWINYPNEFLCIVVRKTKYFIIFLFFFSHYLLFKRCNEKKTLKKDKMPELSKHKAKSSQEKSILYDDKYIKTESVVYKTEVKNENGQSKIYVECIEGAFKKR